MPDRSDLPSTKPIYVRIAECRSVLGVSKSTIYRWIKDGSLPVHKIGAISLIKVSDFEALVEGAE